MKRARLSIRTWAIAALIMVMGPRLAHGDGGVVLLHEGQGPFSVTVFVSSEAAHGGLIDVSVLIQRRTNGEVILDADVGLAVDPPDSLSTAPSGPLCGLPPAGAAFLLPDPRQPQPTVPATRKQASNKLLYAAGLNLNPAGDWPLHVYVSRGSDRAQFNCLLPVARASTELSALWPFLAFPPVVIAAFAMNQRLRRLSLEKGL
jgi:hypothetical protein